MTDTAVKAGPTPGPWRAEWRHPDLAVWGGPDDDHIASIYGDGSIENADANASLIAAAPELFDALKKLIAVNEEWNRDVESIIGRPTHWTDGYLDAARAALAKAEGRS